MLVWYMGEATVIDFEPDAETQEQVDKQAFETWRRSTATEDNGDDERETWGIVGISHPNDYQHVVWAIPHRGEGVTLIYDL